MNTNEPSTKKTYFFCETITIASKGIVANSFDEAQEMYLDIFKKDVKFGPRLVADSSDYTCYSQDENGKETHEY